MLHKEIPFLRIGLPLCMGIITGLYFKPDTFFLFCAFFISLSGFIISIKFNRTLSNLLYGCSLTFSLYIAGLILYNTEIGRISELKPGKTILTGTISDYPEEKENCYIFKIKLICQADDKRLIPVSGSVLFYMEKDLIPGDLLPGDILIVRCFPKEITNKGNPYEFDYRFFMQCQSIRYYSFLASNDILKHIIPSHRKLSHLALITRNKIIAMFQAIGVKGDRLALLAAITLGQKNMLQPDQKLNFLKAGIVHIMAVSGLHAIILSLFVFKVLFFMKGKLNIIRVIITITILWLFAFVTGLTPSVLRATLMYSFLQAGKFLKRPVNGINSVLASAFFLFLARPSVVFDAGFLLSYSAVIFILSFYKDFYLMIHFKSWLFDKIWQSVVVTIVAQTGTLPLALLFFNRFPTYFILANITIVPISNLLIITGCLVPLFFRIGFLSHFFGILLNNLTELTEKMTSWTASLPYSSIENIGCTTTECILLSCTIFLFTYWFFHRRAFQILWPLSALLLLVSTNTLRNISTKRSNEIIVYNTQFKSAIGIRTGKVLHLFSDTTIVADEVKRHCSILGLKIKPAVINNKYHCIAAGGRKILVSKVLNRKIINNILPDIVILNGYGHEINNYLNEKLFPGTFVISAEVSSEIFLSSQMRKSENISIHFVRKSGAFVKSI